MKGVKKYGTIAVTAVLLISLITPFILRVHAGSPITPGAESYAYLDQAESLYKSGWSGTLTEQKGVPTPYAMLLAVMIPLGVPWLLPVLLTILLFFLLFTCINNVTKSPIVTYIALLVLAVSPITSVLGTSYAPELLALDLLLLGFLLFKRHHGLATVVLAFGIITEPLLGILVAAYLLFAFAGKKKKHDMLSITFALIISFGWFYVWTKGIPFPYVSLPLLEVGNVIFELGNPRGMSVFLLLFAGYGLLTPRVQRLAIGAHVFALVLITFFVQLLLPITTIVVAVIAAYGIVYLFQIKWELELLRQALHVLLVCLALFLFIVSVRDRIDDYPTTEFSNTLAYLQQQHREGQVLTLPTYAPMIAYFSGKAAALETAAPTDLFFARDAEKLYDFLEATGTSHILITGEMEQDVFSRSDEGILFILPNTERFQLVYQTEETTLWYYIPRR